MKFQVQKVVDVAAVVATTNYDSVKLFHHSGYSAQVVWTSTTASAVVKLQRSNDNVNWEDVSGATQTIASNSGNVIFNEVDVFYGYFRPVLTYTSGSVTTLQVIYVKKEG